MSQYVLDRAYQVEQSGGVARYRVVASTQTQDGCAYPVHSNAGGAIGITTHGQSIQGKSVSVRRIGIAPCEANAPIPLGAHVVASGSDGKVAAAVLPFAEYSTPGSSDYIRYTSKLSSTDLPITRVKHVVSSPNQTLGLAVSSSTLLVTPATDGSGDVASTANDIVSAINSDPAISNLVSASTHGAAGTGLIDDVDAAFQESLGSLNCIGIAQQAATGDGDVIDVYLTL